MRVTVESVYARIRHRALLETLREEMPFSYSHYLEQFEKICDRDSLPLLDALVLTDAAYREEYAEWLKADMIRYGSLPHQKQLEDELADELVTDSGTSHEDGEH